MKNLKLIQALQNHLIMKVLFIDRGFGTLIKEPQDYQIDAFEKLEFYPDVFYYLKKFLMN